VVIHVICIFMVLSRIFLPKKTTDKSVVVVVGGGITARAPDDMRQSRA
jgi:hypothetical protein